jgi:hypothetical protein
MNRLQAKISALREAQSATGEGLGLSIVPRKPNNSEKVRIFKHTGEKRTS